MDPRDTSLLQDLLDERLDEASAAGMRTRLETEPDLREVWDELRRVRDLVRGPSVERAPPDFLSRVRARIASESRSTGSATDDPSVASPPPAEAPAGRRLAFPRRLAGAVSGLAALILVALGVRWMGANHDGGFGVPETRVLESARGVEPLDRLREGVAPGSGTPPPSARAPAEPAPPPAPDDARGTPMPVTEASAPAAPRGVGPAAGGFGPGDQVPPGLRAPTDEVADRERPEETARRARDKKLGGKARARTTGDPELRTWILEADDLETGRARLALLVAGLETGSWPQTEDAADRGALRTDQDDDVVLGSVILRLSADRAAALDPTRAGGAEEGTVDDLPPRPDTPAPAAREPRGATPNGNAKPAEGPDAARTGGLRVRVLVVRRAAQR